MSLSKEFGRQPFEVVKIYLDKCGQPGFGLGTCTGTGEPCYFGRASCVDVVNFINAPAQDVRMFCSQTARIPDGLEGAIPCILKVNPTPPTLDASGGMGMRASTSVTLADFPHSDIGTDPYVFLRSYDPITQGTYFGKLKARNPFYSGRRMEVLTGYLTADGAFDPANFKSRNYFIDSWVGPVSGQVSITAKDVLRLAGDDKAQAPFISAGRIATDITSASTGVNLLPIGIGSFYPASGTMKIGKELINFTRAGDVVTFVTRGAFGTTPDSHDADDASQECLVITSMKPQDILYLLLTVYAKIPIAFLDKAQWDQEQLDYLPRLYSTVIASPTGVSKLIGEMGEHMGFQIWWDEVEQKVKMRAVRPAENSELKPITEESNIDDSSVTVKDLVDERFNEVWVFYGLIDYTEKLDEPSNYRGQYAKPALSEQDASMDGDVKIKKIFSRWITAQNAVAAYDLADKTVQRSKSTPIELNFMIDAKDSDIGIADFIAVQTRSVQTKTGAAATVPAQVTKRSEPVVGSKIKVTARQTYVSGQDGSDPTPDNVRRIVIAVDDFGVNLRTLHDSIYAAPIGNEIIDVVVRSGSGIGGRGKNLFKGVIPRHTNHPSQVYQPRSDIPVVQRRNIAGVDDTTLYNPYGVALAAGLTDQQYIAASSQPYQPYRMASNSFRTGVWPAGVQLRMTIEPTAFIMGEGGNARLVSRSILDPFLGIPPWQGSGGNGLVVDYPITINNLGTIYAGGAAGSGQDADAYAPTLIIFGGGGQGYGVDDDDENYVNKFGGRVGNNMWSTIIQNNHSIIANVRATAGSKTAPGVGGFFQYGGVTGGSRTGSNGGACGAATGGYPQRGEPGLAIIGNHLITWENIGTIVGEVI